ncbi:hypothetical protein J6590_091763, partial [Homalodisca vitripennis]
MGALLIASYYQTVSVFTSTQHSGLKNIGNNRILRRQETDVSGVCGSGGLNLQT